MILTQGIIEIGIGAKRLADCHSRLWILARQTHQEITQREDS